MTVVLVVDDIPALAQQYAYDLKRVGGYEVVTAAKGSEALDLVTRSGVQQLEHRTHRTGLRVGLATGRGRVQAK